MIKKGDWIKIWMTVVIVQVKVLSCPSIRTAGNTDELWNRYPPNQKSKALQLHMPPCSLHHNRPKFNFHTLSLAILIN